MRRTGDVRLALVLSALAFVACSNPHAGTLPTPSPAPTTPRAPSPTATTSTALDGEVARAAANYYSTLELAARFPAERRNELAALIDAKCECRQVLTLLDNLARKHHTLVFTVTTGTPHVARASGMFATAFIDVRQSQGRELDSGGDVVQSFPGSAGHYVLDFVRRDGRWVITQISRS
jgi:hypothetical protein